MANRCSAPFSPTLKRQNTVAPDSFIEIDISELEMMNDEQLIQWADKILALVIPLGTKRDTILARIMNCAVEGI